MLRSQLKTMLEIAERKVESLTLDLHEEEQRINDGIADIKVHGGRLSEHYWQESHTLRQEIASARFLIGILTDTLAEEDKHRAKKYD